jgi:hypothetical protein
MLSAALLLASCVHTPAPAIQGTVEISTSDSTWTYYSLESGKEIGTSKLLDASADAAWAARKDWDIAVCGDLLRTNGGLSGSAGAAIQRDTLSTFTDLLTAPSAGYVTDTLVLVRR